ncbi:MAG: hypothetical protein FWB74_07730 [Defluviitaleaceae bacterium]|nr:hypothetical protein [Defluviitaleaceae bacterium]
MADKRSKRILIFVVIIVFVLGVALFWLFGRGSTALDDVQPAHPGAYGRVVLALGYIFGLDDSFQVIVTNNSDYRLSGFDFSLQYFDGGTWRLPRTGGRGLPS